ncbi:MAG: WD40/YVTN/BNR-like repeat-containing protein [Acidobacteriaceae bacterium]
MIRSFAVAMLATLAGASTLSVCAQSASATGVQYPKLTLQNSGTKNGLIAVSPVNDRVVWASGRNGTYVITTDGGQHWKAGVVPGAEALQFRDVQGISAKEAYLLSIGNGPDARIYKTEDGGDHWTRQFESQDPNAFYDCFAFWTPQRGIATSDSVYGRFPAIRTLNGESWMDIGDHLPKAAKGEASFAASGTCVATQGLQNAWIVTGGSLYAHVLATRDGGNTWNRYYVPTVQGTPASGIFSVAFRDPWHGIEGAGDLDHPKVPQKNIARSCDGGKTWKLSQGTPFVGAVYGLAYASSQPLLSAADENSASENSATANSSGGQPSSYCSGDHESPGIGRTVVATGPGGAAYTSDEGATWHLLYGAYNYWAVAFASPQSGWFVGTGGRILKIGF